MKSYELPLVIRVINSIPVNSVIDTKQVKNTEYINEKTILNSNKKCAKQN